MHHAAAPKRHAQTLQSSIPSELALCSSVPRFSQNCWHLVFLFASFPLKNPEGLRHTSIPHVYIQQQNARHAPHLHAFCILLDLRTHVLCAPSLSKLPASAVPTKDYWLEKQQFCNEMMWMFALPPSRRQCCPCVPMTSAKRGGLHIRCLLLSSLEASASRVL